MSYTDMVERSGGLQSAVTAVAQIPKPVVAAVTGYALGGGCELALCADIRIAADDATLGQPEVLLGIIPGAGGTQRLTPAGRPGRAKDIIFTGRFVKADEAERIGLVDRVVPAAEVYDEALAWARQFRERRVVRAAGGEGGDRPGSRGRPRHRAGDRARSSSRRSSPPRTERRDAVVRRERTRQGGVHRRLMADQKADQGGPGRRPGGRGRRRPQPEAGLRGPDPGPAGGRARDPAGVHVHRRDARARGPAGGPARTTSTRTTRWWRRSSGSATSSTARSPATGIFQFHGKNAWPRRPWSTGGSRRWSTCWSAAAGPDHPPLSPRPDRRGRRHSVEYTRCTHG